MTGPEGTPARPDEQAVAEAKRWFRDPARPDRIDWIENPPGEVIGWAQKHAATIVRAALAAGPDEPGAALREIAAYGCDRFTEPGDPTCRDSVERAAWCGCCVARAALAGARPAAEPFHDNRCEAEYVHEAPGWTECGCARRAAAGPDLTVVRQHVAAAMHLGLDDATPNETPEDHAPWVERVQEWADFVHEQYAAALVGARPELSSGVDVRARVAAWRSAAGSPATDETGHGDA